MNIVTLSTEENEGHRLKNMQEGESVIKSHNALFQALDLEDSKRVDDLVHIETNQRDANFSAPVEHPRHMKQASLMMPSTTNRIEHRRNGSIIERMRDSLFGRPELKANEKSEPLSSREYQQIASDRDPTMDNQIEIVTTRRRTENGRVRPQSNQNVGEKQIRDANKSRHLKLVLEKQPIIQPSKEAESAMPMLKRSNAAVDTRQYWKKIRAIRHVIKFAVKANGLVDARSRKIMRGKTVVVEKNKKMYFSIHPASKFKFVWDFLISLTLWYYAFVIPWRLAFRVLWREWIYIDLAFDIAFMVDIFLTFLTGIEVQGEITYSKRIIANNYLKSTLAIDVICTLPLYFFYYNLVALKLLRLLKIWRLKVVFDITIAKVLDLLSRERVYLKFYEICKTTYKLLFVLVGCSHFLNCLWIMIGYYTQEAYNESWIQLYGLNGGSDYDIYLQGMMLIITTITTVGFSNYNTFSNLETFFVMFLEIFGIAMMAYFQSNITYVLKKFNSQTRKLIQNSEDLEIWLRAKEIARDAKPLNEKYCHDITSFFRYIWVRDIKALLSDQTYFFDLPPTLQYGVGDLLLTQTMRDFKYFFDFFEDGEFKLCILKSLIPLAFIQGQKIIKRGKRVKGLFFVLDGDVLVSDLEENPLVKLPASSYFGDQIFLKMKSQFYYTATSSIVHCFFLPRSILLSLCEFFPKAEENLEKIALMRHRQLNWAKKDPVVLRRTRKEISHRKRGIQATINPIHETQSKLESLNESCMISDPDAEQDEKNSPAKYAMPLEIHGGKGDLSEPEPELMLTQDLKLSQKRDERVESYIYRSAASGETAVAGNIPNFLLGFFANARVLEYGLEAARKLDQIAKDKALLNFRPPNTFAGGIEEEQDDKPTPKAENRLNEIPHLVEDTGELYPLDVLPQHYLNPLYPLNAPTFEIQPDLQAQGNPSLVAGMFSKSESDLSPVTQNLNFQADNQDDEIENDDRLNRSLEIPISFIQPTFTQEEPLEIITEFLENRLKIQINKLERLKRNMRLNVLDLAKKVRNYQRVHDDMLIRK